MYTNKTVLITGTSRGVGNIIATHFLKHNATVIGLSRGLDTINNANYFHLSVDLAKPEEIINVFKLIAKRFTKVDIVINNAAVLTSQYSMIMPLKNVLDMVNIDFILDFYERIIP